MKNLFQTANGAATFLILSSVVAGLAKHFDALPGDPIDDLLLHPDVILLGLFIILFRIKVLLDDHQHFGEDHQTESPSRYLGFILAVVAWIFWGIAAYLLSTPIRASKLMATSILISTMWIMVHLIEVALDKRRRTKEMWVSILREKWALINLIYMLCLVAYDGWFSPVIKIGSFSPLIVLLGLLLLDMITSRSLFRSPDS